MVKQTKKGSIGKKALSAILAASMIMTSSSFVMAGPVVEEVEAVAVEEVAAEAVEEVDATEENTGAELYDVSVGLVKDQDTNYTGDPVEPKIEVKAKIGAGATVEKVLPETAYQVTYKDNVEPGTASYKVTFVNDTVMDQSPVEGNFTIAARDLNTTNTTVTYTGEAFAFNGEVQHPEATVKYVVNGKEYEIPSSAFELEGDTPADDMISATKENANNPYQNIHVKITDTTHFDDTTNNELGKKAYEIDKAAFDEANIEVVSNPVIYGATKGDFIVKSKSSDLEITQYDVQYYDENGYKVAQLPKNKGTYRADIIVSGKNNYYDGVISTQVVVTDETLEMAVKGATLTIANGNTSSSLSANSKGKYTVEYTGEEYQVKDITIVGMEEGSDYTLVDLGEARTDVGTINVTIAGKNLFPGQTVTIPVEVTPMELTSDKLSDSDDKEFKYKAEAGKTLDGKDSANTMLTLWRKSTPKDIELEEGVDYTYTASSVGNKVKFVITGMGNYTTSVDDETTVSVTVTRNDKVLLSDPSITATVAGEYVCTNTNEQITPTIDKITLTVDDYTLKANEDFKIKAYGDNNAAGEGTIVVEAISGTNAKFAGTRTIKFNISGQAFDQLFQVNPIADVTYADAQLGKGKVSPRVVYVEKPAVSAPTGSYEVKYYRNGKEITNNDEAFKTAGPVEVEIIGKGLYTGTLKSSYNIIGEDISKAKVEDIVDQKWTGSAITPIVKVSLNGTTLTEGKDYTVAYENNVKVGDARVIITGIGNYSGKVIKAFNIVGEMTQEIVVLPAQEKALKSRTLNDKATKVKFEVEPETTKTFTSSDEDVVTVDAEGNIKYTGLGEATITIEAAAENGYKAATKELKVVVGLKQPTFSPSSKNNAFTVTTSTVKGAEKFQVQYVPTGKSFTSKAAKSKTFTVDNKLKKGKISAANKETYRIRVRAINGDTKSKWSPVKTIATK